MTLELQEIARDTETNFTIIRGDDLRVSLELYQDPNPGSCGPAVQGAARILPAGGVLRVKGEAHGTELPLFMTGEIVSNGEGSLPAVISFVCLAPVIEIVFAEGAYQAFDYRAEFYDGSHSTLALGTVYVTDSAAGAGQ